MPVVELKNINQHISWITIDRPDALNAIDFEVMDELDRILKEVEENDEVRILIFSGKGEKCFVSGGDLRKFHSITTEGEAAEMSRRMQHLLLKLEQLPCWTIAFINGDAYGGGIEMMLAFDFRLANQGVKFGFTQGRFNLVPGWGGLIRLVEKTGRAKALQWLGKAELIDAEEALRFGLLEGIFYSPDPNEEVLMWAEKLTRNDREFIKVLKEGSFKVSEYRKKVMEEEIIPFAKLWAGEEHRIRVQRFLEN